MIYVPQWIEQVRSGNRMTIIFKIIVWVLSVALLCALVIAAVLTVLPVAIVLGLLLLGARGVL